MDQLRGKKIGDLTVEEYGEVLQTYNADIYDKIVKLNNELEALRADNIRISSELNEWKERTALLEKDLMLVDKKQKRSNVIFKNLNGQESPKTAVEQVCSQILAVPNVIVKDAKKTFQREGKMTVIAELESENMVNDLLKNSSKLKGSIISVDRDLTRDAREKKGAFLKLKKELNETDSTKKIIVRDDRMKVDNNWFYWNNEKKLMSGSNDEENPYCEIDSKNLVFWRNGVPSLEFTETEVITYQGKNLMKMRSDLETVELWVYILNYYRMLTPDTIQRNIKNMTREDIKKLYAARVLRMPTHFARPINPAESENSNKYRRFGNVHFDFQALKEKSALKSQNAGRYLACLFLSKSYSNDLLPYDPFDAKRFFNDNFKGTIEDVFDKYCESRKEDKNEILSYYRNIAERNRSKCNFEENHQNKFSTIDLLANAFLHIYR